MPINQPEKKLSLITINKPERENKWDQQFNIFFLISNEISAIITNKSCFILHLFEKNFRSTFMACMV